MSSVYNIVINGKSEGPFDVAALTQMARCGMINTDTLVWRNGLDNWCKISALPELNQILYGSVQPVPPIPVTNQSVSTGNNTSSYGASIVGMVCAIVGLISLVVIRYYLPFTVDMDYLSGTTLRSVNHDLDLYRLWFAGLIVGCAFLVLATFLVIRGLVKDHENAAAWFGIIVCVVALVLAILNFTELSQRTTDYTDLKLTQELYEQDRNKQIHNSHQSIKEHNDAFESITAEIEKYANGDY